MTTDERRARLATRHHLAPWARVDSPVSATRDMVALHATDPATVYLSLAARITTPEVAGIERAHYQERTLVRMLGMRRTMFVVPVEFAPVLQAGCTQAIAALERRKLVRYLAQAGVSDDPDRWLHEVCESTVEALVRRGEAFAAELPADEPRLKQKLLVAGGTSTEGDIAVAAQGVTTRVLFLLAAQGRIVRGRPRGSWLSSQHSWAPAAGWLPAGAEPRAVAEAQVELVRRWLAAFGPGTVADLRWWTGWTLGQVRAALATVDTAEVRLDDGSTGLVLADDTGRTPDPAPWVTLLPALDTTVMGYAARGWFLGDHGPRLFDRNGNAGPTVWCAGRVVGGWAQRRSGEVAVRLLEDVDADAAAGIEAEAARLTDWLGAVRVTPRFRTPLERELSA